MSYELLKTIHLLAVISWMAGLFYLPRLYVYHAQALQENSPGDLRPETFMVMERRLLRAIMNPAMIVSWVFGIWLMMEGGWFIEGWFHVKLLCVSVLTIFHMMLARWRKQLARNIVPYQPSTFKIINEIPSLILVVVVALVVLKPF